MSPYGVAMPISKSISLRGWISIYTYKVIVGVVGVMVICKMHENPRMYSARKNEKNTSKSSILYISLS